jgi:hypothetical protein
MITCHICNQIFEMNNGRFLQWHVLKKHNVTSKEYYDLFIKKPNEGLCLECGSSTQYITYSIGYLTYCTTQCVAKNNEIQTLKKKTSLKKYGDKNYNNREKAKETTILKYGVLNASQILSVKEKKQQTCLENHGVTNPQKCSKIVSKCHQTKLKKYGNKNYNNRAKAKATTILKYGVDSYSKSYQYRKYRETLQQWIPEEQLSEFKKYFRAVWRITKRNKKQMLEHWNKKCYYTNEELSFDVYYNNNEYPSIDHKTSIYYGFINNISSEIIGSIENLCICSRIINTKKGILCEKEFKTKLKL